MGFPVGYTEVFFPKLLILTLSLLGFIRNLISTLFRFLGLSDFLEPDLSSSSSSSSFNENYPTRQPANPSVSAVMIRELLPVVKFEDVSVGDDGELPESCAVCLYEFEAGEEIRWLSNCKHIFHLNCLDRWMDHDQKTCPLCRTNFVPYDQQDDFNERLWAASGVTDFYNEYNSISGV